MCTLSQSEIYGGTNERAMKVPHAGASLPLCELTISQSSQSCCGQRVLFTTHLLPRTTCLIYKHYTPSSLFVKPPHLV